MTIYLAETPEGPCAWTSARRAIDELSASRRYLPMELDHGTFIEIDPEKAIKKLRRGALIYFDYDTFIERTTAR